LTFISSVIQLVADVNSNDLPLIGFEASSFVFLPVFFYAHLLNTFSVLLVANLHIFHICVFRILHKYYHCLMGLWPQTGAWFWEESKTRQGSADFQLSLPNGWDNLLLLGMVTHHYPALFLALTTHAWDRSVKSRQPLQITRKFKKC
jgi:hypothetical protein